MQRHLRISIRAGIKDGECDGGRTNEALKDARMPLNFTPRAFISVGLFSAEDCLFSTGRSGRRRPATVFALIISEIELAIFYRGNCITR
jgi:hypothetical protein